MGAIASHNVVAAEEGDIAVILAQELELDQGQTDQMRSAMAGFGAKLDALNESSI